MKIGIDIGGSHIAIGIIDEYGKILFKVEEDLKIIEMESNIIAQRETIQTLKNGIAKILNRAKIEIEDIELVGISFPGDVTDKCIRKAENLGIADFNIVEDLKNTIERSVILKNDAKCAALAEKKYGSLKEYKDAIFIILGTGVGGAAFLDDKLLVPKRHPGFEFGHTVIEKDGTQCNCGAKGCFERYASMKYFKEEILKAMGINLHGKELKDYVKNNQENSKIKEIIDNYIEYLTIGIANFINIFEPEAVCIGGSFTYYEDILLEKLKNNLRQSKVIYNPESLPEIFIAELQNDAGIIGATIQ